MHSSALALLEKGGDTNCSASADHRLINFETRPAAQHAKSRRGMVTWGRRNLDIEIVSGDRFNASLVDRAVEIDGGEGVSYQALIKKGSGFLVQGHYKGELVSNGLFVYNNKTCHLISANILEENFTLNR